MSASCGGRAIVTVLAPVVAPSSSRGAVLVVVPDLRGLDERRAVAALAGRLALAGASAGPGRIRSQDPPLGTRVRPGSAVVVVLESSVQPASTGTALWPVMAAGVALKLVLVAAADATSRGLRRRERRWQDDHVAIRVGQS